MKRKIWMPEYWNPPPPPKENIGGYQPTDVLNIPDPPNQHEDVKKALLDIIDTMDYSTTTLFIRMKEVGKVQFYSDCWEYLLAHHSKLEASLQDPIEARRKLLRKLSFLRDI